MTNQIELSYIITTYRRNELLIRCLESIHLYANTCHEIIVIDDANDPQTHNIASRFGANYISKWPFRPGVATSRNIGLHHAKGKFVTFVDDDDYYIGQDPYTQATPFTRSTNDLLVSPFYVDTNEQGRTLHIINHITITHLLVCNQIPIGAYAIRRCAIRFLFDEDIGSHEDWDFLLKHLYYTNIHHLSEASICIDRTSTESKGSLLNDAKSRFWIDYLTIYSRFPANHLSSNRAKMLESLGLQLPGSALILQESVNQLNLTNDSAKFFTKPIFQSEQENDPPL